MDNVVATQSTLITLSSKSQAKEEENRIVLKVQGKKKADQFFYWVGRRTLFQYLMLDYTKRVGVPMNSVRFLYDGSPLQPFLTADYFKMEDGDIIDVIEWVRYTVAPQSTFITLPRVKGEIPILIEVQAEEGVVGAHHYNRFYMMGRNTPLRNLLLDYCDRIPAFYECMRFRLRDSYVNPDKTADDLDLVDGDIIFSIHVLRGD